MMMMMMLMVMDMMEMMMMMMMLMTIYRREWGLLSNLPKISVMEGR